MRSDHVTSMTRRTTFASAISAALLLGAVIVVDGGGRSRASAGRLSAHHADTVVGQPDSSGDPSERATESVVVRPRSSRERAEQARRRLSRAKAIGAHGAAIVNPCRTRTDAVTSGMATSSAAAPSAPCERSALEPFFLALDALEQQSAAKHASVAVLGNSLIAADHIVDVVRERLVARFGDGGRGFVLADRIADYGTRKRTGNAAAGRWSAHNFSMGERGSYPFGVAGVLHVSKGNGSRTAWRLQGEARARVFFYEHEASPAVRVLVDDVVSTTYAPGHGAGFRTLDLTLPPSASTLTLEAAGTGAVIYGALLERASPGVVVNSFGVPAADATHFLSTDPVIFSDQLIAQDPALIVVMLGGNETKRLHWGRRRRSDVEDAYRALLQRLHEVVPNAACLAVGPIDSVYGGEEKVWRTRTHLSWVIDMQKRVAAEQSCAYFDLFEAMGGAGSLRRFASQGLLHEDMVHPKQAGLDILGELLVDALLDAYEAAPIVERVPSGPRSATTDKSSGGASDG